VDVGESVIPQFDHVASLVTLGDALAFMFTDARGAVIPEPAMTLIVASAGTTSGAALRVSENFWDAGEDGRDCGESAAVIPAGSVLILRLTALSSFTLSSKKLIVTLWPLLIEALVAVGSIAILGVIGGICDTPGLVRFILI
jgi:hypothetical protein